MLIKDLNRECQPKERDINDKDGNILEKFEEIKERWTEYCTKVYEENDLKEELVQQMEAVVALRSIYPPPNKDLYPILKTKQNTR